MTFFPPASPPASPSPILGSLISLTPAQFNALGATPQTLVPAVAGKYIIPTQVVVGINVTVLYVPSPVPLQLVINGVVLTGQNASIGGLTGPYGIYFPFSGATVGGTAAMLGGALTLNSSAAITAGNSDRNIQIATNYMLL